MIVQTIINMMSIKIWNKLKIIIKNNKLSKKKKKRLKINKLKKMKIEQSSKKLLIIKLN